MKSKTRKTLIVVLAAVFILTAVIAAGCAQPTNFDALKQVITTAESKKQSEYTADSWTTFAAALEAAKTVAGDEKASQQQVDEALQTLNTAISGLVIKPVDKTALNAAITSAEVKAEADYTAEKWSALQDKLTAAKAVAAKANATKTEVDKAVGELNAAMGETHGVVWTLPKETFILTNDIVKFRADREQAEVLDKIANLVSAKVDDTATTVITDSDTFPVRGEDGTYPIGTHTVTFQALGKGEQIVSCDVEIEIVDGKMVDYYFYGHNSSVYATTSGNANWKGGEGIRVAKNNFFVLSGDTTTLPEELVYQDKLKDFDDPVAVRNATENDITFKTNDNAGLHILMDKQGKVKMMFEGVQNDFWDETGKTKKKPGDFGNMDRTLKPGDIYFVIGFTDGGNWYAEHSATTAEKHWMDGRFPARNTVGAGDVGGGVIAHNVAKILCNDVEITEAYTNQIPYLYAVGSEVKLTKDGDTPTKSALLGGLVFYDDNGEWGVGARVADDKITVTHEIDMATPGIYEVTYTVADDIDDTLSYEYKRKVSVAEVLTSDYISYRLSGGEPIAFSNASAVTKYNAAATSIVGNISIYDSAYWNANKNNDQPSKVTSACAFGVYVVIGHNGEFIESYFNTNIINAAHPDGATVGDVNDAYLYAKDNVTLEDGCYIMFFQQKATDGPEIRSFAVSLRDAFKNKIGQGTVMIVDVSGLNNVNSLSYTDKDGKVHSFDMLEKVAVYNAKAPKNTGYISVYDASYWNANKTDAAKISSASYGVYVITDKLGNFVKSYFNKQVIDSANPAGITLAEGDIDASKAAQSETLTDGQLIILFQMNDTETVRDFGVALKDSFKNRIGKGRITLNAFAILNVPSVSYENNSVVKTLNIRTYAYNPTTFNAALADITILDKTFSGTFGGFGYGLYVKIDANGVITEVYDGANSLKVYNAENPNGLAVAGGSSNILKGYDFSQLADGEKIIIFPNNSHVAQAGDAPKTMSYALDIRNLCKGETFNAGGHALSLNYIFLG